jgi:uncharacterized hydrophobic protein (TIGR00271 family)
MKIYYIYNKTEEKFVNRVMKYLINQEILFHKIEINNTETILIEENTHFLVTGRLYDIKSVLDIASAHDISVGIIPLPKQKELINTFALNSNFEKSIEIALLPSTEKIDLLYCEEDMVLQEVVIGDVPPLDCFSSSMEGSSIWQRIKSFISIINKVRYLKHTSFKITTSKEKILNFSAIGAVGVEYNNRTFASKLIHKHLKSNDGRLSLVILSPTSILQYIHYIFSTHILRQTPKNLPSSVGYVHSGSLFIEPMRELPVTIDSDRCIKTPILLKTKAKALSLSVGEEFWNERNHENLSKENVKVDHLPSDKEMSTYLGKNIPLFTHASKEQFSGLFSSLREDAQLNSTFMTLLILATIIATFGLYINSAGVIIGAMLLAPLMQPIVSASMGLLRQDSTLLLNSLKSIFLGVLAVLFSAMIIALLLPMEQLTSEMNGRLSPTILDMFVAIISGVVAAYAKSNEKIIGSLAGVSIAVALVPPIAVSGIGLGWGDWSMFSSAFLLFITNLVGIMMATALTFMMLGFSPLHIAKKGITYAIILVTIVSIPLYISFDKMIEKVKVEQTLHHFKYTIGAKEINLQNITIQKHGTKIVVRCEVVSSDILSKQEKSLLKEKISTKMGEDIEVLASFLYRL